MICRVANSNIVTRLEFVATIIALSSWRPAALGLFQRKAPVPANESLCSVRLSSWNPAPSLTWREALPDSLAQIATGRPGALVNPARRICRPEPQDN
jgi:dTDP-4-dehydrorhamnose reductase